MIAEACKRIRSGSGEKISLGDISVKKEWTFAGDVVEGIWLLVNQNTVTEAVIGSGKAYSIQDWLEVCFEIIGKDWKEHLDKTPNFTPEYSTLVSNPTTLKNLGWKPKMDLEDLAKLMLT
jgi:GDPmannose 4,6-dehydratase